MRFCSKERMQEVVLKTVFKISEREMSQSDLLRTVTNLLNDLDKVFLYKNLEHQEKEDVEKFNYDTQLKDNYFLAKLIRKSLVREQHEVIECLIMQKLFSLYIYLSRQIYMRIKILQTLNASFEEEYRSQELSCYHGDRLQPNESANPTFQQLILHRNDLLKTIRQRQYLIAVLRYYAIQQSIHLLQITKEAQMLFFKGMTLFNQKLFIKEYFKLKEEEVMNACDVDYEIQLLLSKESNQKSCNDSTFVKGYQLAMDKPNIEKLNIKAQHVKLNTLKKIKLLGTKTGHAQIFEEADDEQCKVVLQDFENHEVIKKPLSDHLKLTKEQYQSIKSEMKSLAIIDEQAAKIQAQLKLNETSDVTLAQQIFDKIEEKTTDICLREKQLSEQFDFEDLEDSLNNFNYDEVLLSVNPRI